MVIHHGPARPVRESPSMAISEHPSSKDNMKSGICTTQRRTSAPAGSPQMVCHAYASPYRHGLSGASTVCSTLSTFGTRCASEPEPSGLAIDKSARFNDALCASSRHGRVKSLTIRMRPHCLLVDRAACKRRVHAKGDHEAMGRDAWGLFNLLAVAVHRALDLI
ncbi:hypothetical protein BD413DRAFT_595495 [Trametes elegans]|nr:hypothetical protein BD413DRAFT_595495 [Trametes elegans]